MKMKLTSFLFSSILLALLYSPLIFAQETTPTGIPFEQRIEIFPTAPKFYKIDLSQLPQGLDVSLSAVSNKGNAPKIFVSKKEESQYPSDARTADYESTNSDGNIIFIANTDLAGVQNLYVGLFCSSNKCEADLTFDYSREFVINADGSRHVETVGSLGGASSAVVRLNVPDVPDAERIVIHVDAIPTSNEKPPEITVFINQGDKIPFTNHAENIPRTSWFEGKTIVIYKNTNIFCTSCRYTLSLKFNEFSSIAIEADVFTTDTELRGEAILDGVRTEKSNTYTVRLQEERKNEDLVIDIKPQEGSPTVYINCDERPKIFTGYYWIYQITKPQEIILTSREHQKCQTGVFYLLVYGNQASVYSIRVMSKKANKLFVGKDSPILGDIFPNETISYEIFVPLFSAEKVIVELKSKAKLKMDVINCRFPTDCPGLLPAGLDYKHQVDGDSKISYQPPEFKFDLAETPTGQTATIDPHAEGCYPILIQDPQFMEDPMPVCAYKISLFSGNDYPEEYTLKADSLGHQWLFVGIPKLASVARDEYAYFILSVPHKDTSIVNIQLTKFSGNVDIFVSKTEKYPRAESDSTKFSHEGLIIFQNEPGKNEPELNGTYYISVLGMETSSFSISCTVLTSNNKSEDYAQTLNAGIPQKGVILPKHEHPGRFYKFTLDLDDKWEGSLVVGVNIMKGSVLVAINNNDIVPLPNVHTWKGINQEIEILSTDTNFKRKATYYVGVFVDWTKTTPDDITFNIMYYLKEGGQATPGQVVNLQHLFLSPLTPFHRTIKKNEIDYYEAFILPKDTGITVYKKADSGDVDLYLSLDQENKYPNEKGFTYSTKNTHKDFIELTKEDLEKACAKETILLCSFYVSVVPKSDQNEVYYSLTMKREYAHSATTPLTPLEDGRQLQLTAPAENVPSLFYFYTVPFRPAVVTISCPGKDITIFAKLKSVEIGSQVRPDVDLPTAESNDFNSKSQEGSSVGLAYLTIPAQNDLRPAVVSLAVYFKNTPGVSQSNDKVTFDILVSSQMTHIYTGQPYYGAVAKGQYMYYYLNVFKPSCTLLISMTTLDDGDPDLVVSNSADKPPTVDFHQFASISKQRTELLEINELDVYPLNSMEGTWVIGVYGRTASTFTLTVVFEDQKMVQLKQNVPFETYLKEGSLMYFKYYHEKADNVEIRVDQVSGEVTGYVTRITRDLDIVSNLPNKTNNLWVMNPSEDSILNIPVDDSKACTECLYLVSLEAKAASKLSITISEGVKFTQIQNGIRYNDQLAPNSYKTYKFASSNVEEVLFTVSVKGPKLNVFASHNPTINQTVFMWATEVTSSHPTKSLTLQKSALEAYPEYKLVFDGTRDVPSERNTFYFFFENPSAVPVTYSYSVSTKDASPILKSGHKHSTTIEAGKSTSLLFYSSQDDEVLKINIEFSIMKDLEEGGADNEFERNLKRGLPISASFWAERVTAGSGQDVALIKEYVMRSNTEDRGTKRIYNIRQAVTTVSRKGKFSIDIENPFFSEISVAVTVYSSEFGVLSLDQNSQHSSSLTRGVSETYEIYLGHGGAWYLWVHSCTGDLNLKIADNTESLEGYSSVVPVPSGEQHMAIQLTGADSTKYVKLESGSKDAQFIMSSSFFNQQSQFNYEPLAEPSKIQTEYVYQSLNSQLNVKFNPLNIQGIDATDEIIYHIKVCPYKESDPDGPQNFCKIYEECKLSQQKFFINNQKSLDLKFERLLPGKHYVQVTADIQHNSKLVRFIPYQTQMVEISEPVSSRIGDIIGILVLILVVLSVAVFVCYKCYGKFKKIGEERGFELPDFGRKKGYGFVGDDL